VRGGAHGGDMITRETFNDFDLQWDWKVPASPTTACKYLVTEDALPRPGRNTRMIDDRHCATITGNNQPRFTMARTR